jgi:hypothetical protein
LSKLSAPARRTSKKKLEKLQKHMRALEMRLEGKTLEEIKNELGYADKTGARDAVLRGVQKIEIEPVDQKRKLYLCKLNALDAKVYTKACKGDLEAVKTWLKVLDGEMKLVPGLEVPKQVQILMAEVQAFIQIVLNVVGKADARLRDQIGREFRQVLTAANGLIQPRVLGMLTESASGASEDPGLDRTN